MTPRAITGLGIVSALGTGEAEFFRHLKSGTRPQATTAPTSFDLSKYPDAPVLEVPDFDPTKVLGDKGLRTLDRLTKLLVVAARLCLQHAGYKKDGQWAVLSPEEVGVCCSNAYGSLEAITELDRVAQLEDARYINPAKFPNTVSNSASGYVSIWEDLRALNVSVSDGNCGGLDALSCADMFLSGQRASAILTGGGEAMSEALYLAFSKLGIMQRRASTSSAKKSATTSDGPARLSEGAAFVAVETLELAKERGARVLAEAIGYGTAFVAPTSPAALLFASREALARAVRQAIDEAGIAASDIDVALSGASGIAAFDDEELGAIDDVLGDVAVAAPKFLYGETLGAGGALGLATAIGWFDGAAPTPLVGSKAPGRIDHVLVTSVGYYGNASAVVVRRPSGR